jgi:hypothetical protein
VSPSTARTLCHASDPSSGGEPDGLHPAGHTPHAATSAAHRQARAHPLVVTGLHPLDGEQFGDVVDCGVRIQVVECPRCATEPGANTRPLQPMARIVSVSTPPR